MFSHAQTFARRTSMVAFVCLIFCSLQVSKVSSFPADGSSKFSVAENEPLARKSSGREGEQQDKDEGLSTMDWVWIGLGILAALIIVSCIISYLFCECVKNIICLPCTCLCCCCD